MVSGGRRSGGMFHDEVAQGRGGEQLATSHNNRGAKSDDKVREGGEGRGSHIDAAVDECRN